MTSYPALKRWLAATITACLLAAAVVVVLRNGASNPLDANALVMQGSKQDWVMYGGTPSRNMANTTVKGLPVEWDVDAKKPVNIKWSASLGSKAYGGPIVANGRVFVGTNNQGLRDPKWVKLKDPNDPTKGSEPIDLGIVMSFEELTGKFQWQSVFTKLPGGQVVDWPLEGICSSPHIEGDRMYFVSNSCKLVCADVTTGKAHWTLDMIKTLDVFPHNISSCSPLLVGDYLWVVTSNGVNEDHINVPAPKAPSFIKVDKKNGAVLWQDNSPTASLLVVQKGNENQKDFFKNLVNRGELIQHGQWANPAYATVDGQPQIVFPGGDGWIYSFDPQGKLIWKFDCNPKDAKYELAGKGTRSDFIGTPVIYKNRVYIGVGQDPEHLTGVGHFYCIDMSKKGDVSTELVTDNSKFPPATKKNPNSAQVWHYGGIIEDPALQKKLKRNYYFGRTMSTAAIHEDIVYITDLGGIMHCLDANTGKLHWEFDVGFPTWSSPYYADGKVYLGTDGRSMWVFEHGAKLKAPTENDMGSRVRAAPVAANGVLYVMTENRLYAIAEGKKK